MRRGLLAVLGSILLASVAFAQESRPIHITDHLMRQPEAQRAAQSLLELKKRGIDLSARKTTETYRIGEKRVFKVRDIAAEETKPAPQYFQAEFTLMAESERFLLWVESAELTNQHVRTQDITALQAALADQTPQGSVNPNEGIIVNDENTFGRPPDVDNTGKSDVLLTDIRDNFSGEGFIAGFVDPLDVLCLQPTTQHCTPGNMRDILYLDTTPGLFRNGQYRVENVLPTAAHEYQHLIHLAYDPDEIAFVNEGLSEFAEVVNGYQSRPITYLSSEERYNVPLFRWSEGLEQDVMDDYERAGLFTNYIGDRFGFPAAGSITRTTNTQADDAYESMLAATSPGLTFEQLLLDFHTANYVNEQNSVFGYKTSQRAGIRAQPSTVFDGQTGNATPATPDTVEAGAVKYLVWNNVEQFALNIDVTTDVLSQEAVMRARMRLRLILEPTSGARTVQDLSPQASSQSFPGSFSRVTLVVAHVQPEEDAVLSFRYNASWSGQQTAREQTFVYDDGVVPSETGTGGALTLEAYSLGAGAMMANRFNVPRGSTLTRVSVAPYYESQFGNVATTEPRNFRLHVWQDAGNGLPGTEIFAADFTDPRISNGANLNFYAIELAAYRQQLSNLPGPVFVGISNTGTDANYIVMGVTQGTDDDSSFVFTATSQQWRSFPSVRASTGEAVLENRVLPLRATFLIPTTPVASEDDPSLPELLALDQNYPNPFGRETLITYRLPTPESVVLEVYDALGRRVAVLVEETLDAGSHTTRFAAAGLSSGVYFYRLRVGNKVLSRQMVVVR